MESSSSDEKEEEIHDLVLMFAQSKIPRGSDAFKAVLDELISDDEEDEVDGGSREVDDDAFVAEDKPSEIVIPEIPVKKSSVTFDVPRPPKTPSHVHWPDEQTRSPIASSPAAEKRHHARLFMKTVPKPILKHDEECSIPEGDTR